MTFKNKYLSMIAALTALICLFACNSKESVTQTDYLVTDSQVLTIDTFSTFPPEIDGCSCYFSNDSIEFKKGKYIYMDNNAQIAFLKINNVLTKFTRIDFKETDPLNRIEKYKNDDYKITIETKEGVQNGDETSLYTGTIKLTNKNGKTITKTFYGECGC